MIDASPNEPGPQYVTDASGNRVGVLLDLERYEELLDAHDELDAIRAFDEAKAAGDEMVPLKDALREIERDRQAR